MSAIALTIGKPDAAKKGATTGPTTIPLKRKSAIKLLQRMGDLLAKANCCIL
jgi:hypothetical protein